MAASAEALIGLIFAMNVGVIMTRIKWYDLEPSFEIKKEVMRMGCPLSLNLGHPPHLRKRLDG